MLAGAVISFLCGAEANAATLLVRTDDPPLVRGEPLPLAPAKAVAPSPEGPPPPTLLDEVRALREEVKALRDRPEPATAADLEGVRAALERLSDSERALSRAAEPAPGTGSPGDPPSPDPVLLSPLLLLMGGIVGWTASRLFQRRRDSRQRSRLRL